MEEWRKTPISEDYSISNKGNCYSHFLKRLMTPDITNSGHIQFWTKINGKKKPMGGHVLVALAFIPIPDNLKDIPYNKLVVHHIDGNPQNNTVENLCWMSKQAHQELHTGMPVCQYTKNGEFVKELPSAMEAHRHTGISSSGICRVCNGVKNYKTAGGFIWKYKSLF